ncbi:MAG TPA: DUF4332 domain-containing protein [Caldithrix abyssi]|uniref:DUF4332 domain-containing protein n=1 Tax=Caldithrix abyssi TaxID=187145 RepID=A0A7V1LLF0_CALAY|nr:DUF4332 domain-containing protein [Caldithrix abyssi]
MNIEKIEGIGPAYAAKLAKAGIKTVNGLLKKGADPAGRKAISEESGVSGDKVLDFVNMADLFRIKGVSSQYAELLKGTGVDTVKELAQRNANNLHEAMVSTNKQKKLVRLVPSAKVVARWVEQAKNLPRVVNY